MALRLLERGRIPREALQIVDPSPTLLCKWRSLSARTGMQHLRSPTVHNLGSSAWTLTEFARERAEGLEEPVFLEPYDRPSLQVFNAHCDRLIQRAGLAALHHQAEVQCMVAGPDEVRVALSTGEVLHASNVVLAVGAGGAPHWPSWAPPGAPGLHHATGPGSFAISESAESIAVIGGGLTACQLALKLQREQHQVTLISRHALRVHQFDTDPGWLGPKFMQAFSMERSWSARREAITRSRNRGSIPPDVDARLADSGLRPLHAEVVAMRRVASRWRLSLVSGAHLTVDRVVLATGLSPRRPGGAMVDRLVQEVGLPTAPCGFPIVDPALRWHPRIRVSGALAELELGPSARNIAGAQRAADRVLGSLRGEGPARGRPQSRTPGVGSPVTSGHRA